MRAAEEWARRIISVALSREVELHDDGSQPSMYDLRIGPADSPERAIEVVGAVDPVWTETWNVGPARELWQLGLRGDWMVSVDPGANFRQMKKALPDLLRQVEDDGLAAVPRNDVLRRHRRDVYDAMANLGVDYMSMYRADGSGSVTFTMAGAGGAVDNEGLALSRWVEDFLADPGRADVRFKLDGVAPHRDVFIGVTLDGAPWAVVSYLTKFSRTEASLPPDTPALPQPVTGVWVAATLSFGEALGVRYEDGAWSWFRSRGDGIDSDP